MTRHLLMTLLLGVAAQTATAAPCAPEGDFARFVGGEQEHISIRGKRAVIRNYDSRDRALPLNAAHLRQLEQMPATVVFTEPFTGSSRGLDLIDAKGVRRYMVSYDCARRMLENASVGEWQRVRGAQL